MQEDVIINVMTKGMDVADKDFENLAANADKVSVKVDALTGKFKGSIETVDKQTGVIKKLVVEDGKLVSATESVTKSLSQQSAEQDKVAVSAGNAGAGITKFLTAIGAFVLIKQATAAIIEHVSAIQTINAQLQGLTATTAQYAVASAAFQTAANGNATVMAAMVSSFAELQTLVPASSLNVQQFAATMQAAANAMKASGADAKTVADGIKELSKAMSDGRITGEEFAALYVKFPQLGKTLADSLGMSIETMSKLGISTQAATKALLDKQDALAKQAEASKTLNQAIDDLKDAFFKELDQLNKNYNLYQNVVNIVKAFMQAVSVLIGVLAQLFKWLMDIATALGLVAAKGNDATAAINKQTQASNAQASAANSAAMALNRQAQAQNSLSGGKTAYAPNSNPDSSYRSSVQESDYVRKMNRYGNEYDVQTEIKYRAAGGPVKKNSPYIVGEEGPEFFVPGRSGTIIPNGGTGSPLSGGGGSPASRAGAIEIVSEGVGRALETPLKAVNASLDAILSVLKTAQASASSVGNGSLGGSNGVLPGTSAINNYVATGQAIAPAGGNAGAAMGNFGGAGGGGGSSDAVADYGSVRRYARELADLQIRYQRNLWGDPTMQFSRTQGSFTAYRRYLDSIPQNIRADVESLASSLVPAAVGGQVSGFRTGGSINVGGSSGADSKLMQMLVSPGEQVDIRTRRQVRADEDREYASGGNTIIVQIATPDADSFKRSEKQMLRDFAVKVSRALEG